jgi:Asp-tRNA(Asn)/Glu-tRNA(Gln) amidotransferase A subunit family amidase
LPAHYHSPLTSEDRKLLGTSVEDLSASVRDGTTDPVNVVRTYGKVALKAHAATNCLTEILFTEAEESITSKGVNLKGPLAGIPVSLKDSIVVAGNDSTIGYSRYAGVEADTDGVMVRLLKEAGAVPFVKTNLPITLLSFESANDVWGTTTNPHNRHYSPGGSTGGESALLAFGGSRIGVGSDVAGSVRVPAHWAGCASLKCSTGRWPKAGIRTSTAGQEGIPSVYSPMARTVEDLRYFTRSFIQLKPWRLDHSVHPIEWRDQVETEWDEKKVFKVGVLRSDGKLSIPKLN